MIIYKFTDVLKVNSSPKIIGTYIINFGDKKYIGSSTHVLARLNYHRVAFRKGNHKYSKDVGNFNESDVTFKVFKTKDYLELEMLMTKEYKEIGVALNSSIGKYPSKEHLKKLSKSRKGSKRSDETKEKMSKARKGKSISTKGKPWTLNRRLAQENRNNNLKQ